MGLSKKRVGEVIHFYQSHSEEETREIFGLSPGTLRRYLRYWKNSLDRPVNRKAYYLKQIKSNMSRRELKTLADNYGLAVRDDEPVGVDTDGEKLSIAVISDLHIGSCYTNYDYVKSVFDFINKQKVDFVVNAGDITDSLTRRGDHIYKLTELGFDPQKDKAVELFRLLEPKQYAIIGNHDRWYIRKNNSNMGLALEQILGQENFEYIGNPNTGSGQIDDIGNIETAGINIRLTHYGSTAYTISYAMQKYLRALHPKDIPDLLFMGHTHKSFYMHHKGCHCFNSGCLQDQTSFMHSKQAIANTGFWIVDLEVSNGRITKIVPKWYPKKRGE